MKTLHRKSNFLRGFDKLTTRRGISGIAVVLIVAGFFVVSIGFLSWKFKPGDSSQEFFNRTSALISKTFGDIFSSRRDMPVAEIDLGKQATSTNNGEIKNTSVAVNISSGIQPSRNKKSTGKISENKNSAFPVENPIAQSSTSENNFSATSSPDSELPTVDNSKISESSSPASCDFKKVQTPNHKILFSEIAWMGSVKSASDEWIELKNNSGQNLPLRGWQILSEAGNNGSTHSTSSGQASSPQIKIIFDQNNFPAGGFYLLERSDDNSAPNISADKIYSGALSNDGVRLRIFNADCELADEIDASKSWPAGDNAGKKTMERSSLDLSWHTSAQVGGTPKADNSAAFSTSQPLGGSIGSSQSESAPPVVDPTPQTATTSSATGSAASDTGNAASTSTSVASTSNSQAPAPIAPSHILISGIQTTGGSGKTTNDFVKIFNPLSTSFNLKGYRLVKRTKTGTSDTSLKSWTADAFISPGGYYLWANSAFVSISETPNATTTGSIADDNGAAIRFGPEDTGALIDSVAWGAAQNAFVEGSVYPTNPAANQILARKIVNAAMQDTDNNAADFEIK